jgi:ribonuclease-3
MKDEAKDIAIQSIEAQPGPDGEAATKSLVAKTPEAKTPEPKTPETKSPGAKTPEAKAPAKKKRTRSRKAKGSDANAALEARIGYSFTDPNLLMQGITHVSALKSGRKRGDSYQRLEFLGDHVLGLVVSDMLYHAFPNADEGELSKRLAELVRKESCADVAKSLGLLDDIKLGSVGSSADARLRKSVLGDICEAVIGAVFLDGGYAAHAQAAPSSARSQDRVAGMGTGQGAADAGLPRGRAHRPAPRSAIPRRGGSAWPRAGRGHRRQQARSREGGSLGDDRTRRRRRQQ